MTQFKACGARNLPSIDYGRNAAWLQMAALATSLTAWLRHIGLDGDLATASTKTLRFRVLSAPARLVTHARRRILKDPTRLGMVRRSGHRLGPPPGPAPHLRTRPPPVPTIPQHPAGRGTGAHPSTLGYLSMPDDRTNPTDDPQIRRSRSSGSA